MSERIEGNKVFLLSQYYHRLDLEKVQDTFFDLRKKNIKLANKFLREACKQDPIVLAWVILPRWKFFWFHRVWLEHVIDLSESLVLAPRGSAKSTLLVTILAVWALINNKDLRIGVFSQTHRAAKNFVSFIKKTFQSRMFKGLFGIYKDPEDWKADQLSVRGRSEGVRGSSVIAYGANSGSVTGSHFDLVFVDDIVNLKNSQKAENREALMNWIANSFAGCLEEHTQQINVGTRYHPSDYWGHLIKAGIPVNPKETREAVFNGDIEEGELLWAEKISRAFLRKWVNKFGRPAFNLQMLNNVGKYDGQIFKRQYFRHVDWDRVKHYKFSDIVLSIDTAFKQDSRNDFTGIAVCAKMSGGQLLVMHSEHGKYGFTETVRRVKYLSRRFAVRKIVIEVFIKGGILNVDKNYLLQALRDAGLAVKAVTVEKDKTARYWDIARFYEVGQVFHLVGQEELEAQMVELPDADNDDLADAVYLGLHELLKGGKMYSNIKTGEAK